MVRVTDLAQNKLIRSVILNTQDRITDRQLQISTLQKSQDYAGVSADSSRIVTLESAERRIDQYLSDNTLLNLRLGTALNSVEALQNTLDEIHTLLVDIVDDGSLADGVDKDDLADIKMQEVQDFLNISVNGRYLFAGSKTQTKPVVPGDLSTAPTFDATFNTTAEPSFYYQGDDTVLKARIEEGVSIGYGVTAADSAFEKLVRTIRVIRSTDLADPDAAAKFQNALTLLEESETELTTVELNIATRIKQVDTTNATLTTNKNYFQTAIGELEGANTYEAVAELTQDQTMLEASYNTLVRLSTLTLTSFL